MRTPKTGKALKIVYLTVGVICLMLGLPAAIGACVNCSSVSTVWVISVRLTGFGSAAGC